MRRFLIGFAVIAMATTTLATPALAADASVVEAGDTTVTPAGDTVGVFDAKTGQWALRDRSGNATLFFFGNPGDSPLVGDWNGDGTTTPGLYRQSDGFAYLRNSNTEGTADVSFFVGNPGDVPLAGDFNGDGKDTISVFRPSTGEFFVVNSLGSGSAGVVADSKFVFGNPSDKPFVGDFDGNGVDTVGLHRESTGQVFLRNSNTTGIADSSFFFGNPNDQIMAADWTRDGKDTVGVFRPSEAKFYLRYANSAGPADVSFFFGNSDSRAVAGNFKTGKDIVDTAVADGRFKTLAAALGAAGLVDTLKGPGPFTVFAPTDDAFNKLPAGTVPALLSNIPALTSILTYHVVSGEVPASKVVKLPSAKTVQGQDVWIKVQSDGKVFVNDAQVIITDVYASNGVIHVIDTVLQPLDIVDTAKFAGFDTLTAALTATEGTTKLATALKGTGPFTVFTPTNEAFAKIPAATLNSLLADPGGTLSEILKYHVVSGEVKAATLVTLPKVTTLQGKDATVTVSGSSVKINDANVTATDIMTTNGVIHVIDTVLTPPS